MMVLIISFSNVSSNNLVTSLLLAVGILRVGCLIGCVCVTGIDGMF